MNIFWNRNESRLRAFWRLVLQSILMFIFSGVTSLIVVLVVFYAPGGAAATLQRTDMYDALMEYFMQNPYASLMIILASFVAVFFSIWLAARLFDKRPMADFGFHLNRKWWLDFAFGLGLGALLMAIVFGVEWAAGWVTVLPQTEKMGVSMLLALFIGLMKFILVGIQEEMVSRGYHLVNLAEGLSGIGRRTAVWLAFILSSIVFGLLHLGNPNVSIVSTINLCIAGILLGLPYILTGELALSIGLHITWNFFQGFVFGFPVSGLPSSNSLILIQQGGPSLWTGGSFGPEGGLLGLITMILGMILIFLWVKGRHGRAALAERIGVYSQNLPQVISSTQPAR